MARPPSTQPTDGELEILRVLWSLGPAGIGQVHAALNEKRPVALTTVATVLKTMLEKELVRREDGPKGYAWSARVSREATATGLVGKLLGHVFDGSAHRLVAHLIQEGKLNDRERAEILDLLKAPPAPRNAAKKKGGKS
jgi:BlaI family penicillinase repressor